MKNKKIRDAINASGKRYWEVAKLIGIADTTLSRKLREELPAEEQARIIALIHAQEKEENA
ncbi:MAG: hypothetical protein Q4C54_07475 [Clostridia bacterium]|nr:hypothetical protein [Clostridia bacterium]